MEGGNEANGVSGITHRRALTAEKTSPADNLRRSRKTFPDRERKFAIFSRKVRKETIGANTFFRAFAAETSKIPENVIGALSRGFAGGFVRQRKFLRRNKRKEQKYEISTSLLKNSLTHLYINT